MIGLAQKQMRTTAKTMALQNMEISLKLKKIGDAGEAKAALIKLLGAFPVPKDGQEDYKTLKDIPNPPGYDKEALIKLNEMLESVGIAGETENSKKTDLEALQALLTSTSEKMTGENGQVTSRNGLAVSQLTSAENIVINIDKQTGSTLLKRSNSVGNLG
jgi:hypothetical protein